MEKQKYIIRVKDFSLSPGPRYTNQGDDSGESYYHEILNIAFANALSQDTILVVDLDGPDGYASSFLDEAFGNLIYDFGIDAVNKFLEIKSDEEPEWCEMLKNDTYSQWEKRRKNNLPPKVTSEHKAWKRLINDKIEEKVWMHSCSGK